MTGGGGPRDFFGSKMLAKRDVFGSMKDAEISIVFLISSNQREQKRNLLLIWFICNKYLLFQYKNTEGFFGCVFTEFFWGIFFKCLQKTNDAYN